MESNQLLAPYKGGLHQQSLHGIFGAVAGIRTPFSLCTKEGITINVSTAL